MTTSSRLTYTILLLLAIAVSAMAQTQNITTTPASTSIPATTAGTSPASTSTTPVTTNSTPAASAGTPILIVWAHTDLEKQGKPTLDLLDLERYFVEQLGWRTVATVWPSTTAKLPDSPASNTYFLELSVDALQPAVRSERIYADKKYQDLTVFTVELSLTVKCVTNGAVLGKLTQTAYGTSPHGIDDWPMAEKRSATRRQMNLPVFLSSSQRMAASARH